MSAVTEVEGRVMGTSMSVVVVGGAVDASELAAELDRLERAWSRFAPASELSRLNGRAGQLTVVSPDLMVLLEHLIAAHTATGGRFDPTMGASIAALGYDTTFREIVDRGPLAAEVRPGGAHVELIGSASAVMTPPGVALDPGGLGKGLAADLTAAMAMAAGADGVLVDLGGDIVVRGRASGGGTWRVEVPGAGDRSALVVELTDGAVATSDSTTRQWTRAGRTRSHVLDPSTGTPVERDLRCTVVAGAGWWAEAMATAAMVSMARGDGWLDDVSRRSVSALWVDDPTVDVELGSWRSPDAVAVGGAHV